MKDYYVLHSSTFAIKFIPRYNLYRTHSISNSVNELKEQIPNKITRNMSNNFYTFCVIIHKDLIRKDKEMHHLQ